MKRDYREEDMYDLVRDHFQELGYQVNGEVRDCDVTAFREDALIVIELKKSLSVDLLIQAVKRQKISDLTYICVPKPKKFTKNRKFGELLTLLKRLSLGLIYCEPERARLEIMLHPQEFDLARSKTMNKRRRDQLVREIEGRRTSLNRGGQTGKRLMTAYREDAIRLAWLCESQGGTMAPKDGTALGLKKAPAILRDNYYGWFQRVSRGVYCLTEQGSKALTEHSDILEAVVEEMKKMQALQENDAAEASGGMAVRELTTPENTKATREPAVREPALKGSSVKGSSVKALAEKAPAGKAPAAKIRAVKESRTEKKTPVSGTKRASKKNSKLAKEGPGSAAAE